VLLCLYWLSKVQIQRGSHKCDRSIFKGRTAYSKSTLMFFYTDCPLSHLKRQNKGPLRAIIIYFRRGLSTLNFLCDCHDPHVIELYMKAVYLSNFVLCSMRLKPHFLHTCNSSITRCFEDASFVLHKAHHPDMFTLHWDQHRQVLWDSKAKEIAKITAGLPDTYIQSKQGMRVNQHHQKKSFRRRAASFVWAECVLRVTAGGIFGR
jgi:hypothetical protein